MRESFKKRSPAWALLFAFLSAGLLTEAVAMDYTLNVFGNANMDKTIDERDVSVLKAVINGKEEAAPLADAGQDGRIDEKDIDQVKRIMAGEEEEEIFVLDALNRTVKVGRPVKRVVALRLAIAEAIKAMGADDKIVGVGSDTAEQPVLFPDLSQLPSVGKPSLSKADSERIISLKPDIVLVNEYEDAEQIKKLEAAGITVISSECHGDLLNSIAATKRLGYILGVADKAEEYTDWYGSYLDHISEEVKDLSEDEKPHVFYYWNWGEENGPLGTSGKDCPTSALIECVGGRDIAAGMPGEYIEVDPEWVIKQNPSHVVREIMYKEAGYDVNDASIAEEKMKGFENRSGFSNIDAVKKGNVHIIAVNILSDNSWIGAVYMAKMLHPELFQDLDPRAVHQEYLTRFQRLDFDIYNQRLFVYPKPEGW